MKTTPDIVWDFYTKAPATCNLSTGENTTRYGLNVLILVELKNKLRDFENVRVQRKCPIHCNQGSLMIIICFQICFFSWTVLVYRN